MKALYFFKVLFFLLPLGIISEGTIAQITTGSITVGGDFNKFYPVAWSDGNWYNGISTELQITRADVHENSVWRGSLMSSFEYHVTNWGHGSSFLEARVFYNVTPFIAGWRDATGQNSSSVIIIWLKGGGTTYHYTANAAVNPLVYDGVLNALPLQEVNGPAHSFKTSIDSYVNSSGISEVRDYLTTGQAFFMNNVGIGTQSPDAKLAVKGIIHAQEVRVDLAGAVAPDYVFEKDYSLPPLTDVENYIKQNKHLPEIPSAREFEDNGLNLKEMNLSLLKKVEELTLYTIEQGKKYQDLLLSLENLKKVTENQQKQIEKLEKANLK